MTRKPTSGTEGESDSPDAAALMRKAIPQRTGAVAPPEPTGLQAAVNSFPKPAVPVGQIGGARSDGRISPRTALLLGYITLAVLLGGFGVWSVVSSIAGAVVASGQIEVDQHRQVVQHPDGGVVAEINVHEGDKVEAGQVLIRLDGDLDRSERSIVEGQFFELLARRGRLEAERVDAPQIHFHNELVEAAKTRPDVAELVDGQQRLFEARAQTLRKSLDQVAKRRDQTQSQIEGIEAQRVAIQRQQQLIEQELTDQRGLLAKGLAQASRVLALEREAANLAGQVGELLAQKAQAEGKVTELDLEALRLTSQRREDAESELRDIGYRELELAERRRSLTEKIERLDLRAPVAGIVYAMTVTTPRSVIRTAKPAASHRAPSPGSARSCTPAAAEHRRPACGAASRSRCAVASAPRSSVRAISCAISAAIAASRSRVARWAARARRRLSRVRLISVRRVRKVAICVCAAVSAVCRARIWSCAVVSVWASGVSGRAGQSGCAESRACPSAQSVRAALARVSARVWSSLACLARASAVARAPCAVVSASRAVCAAARAAA